MFQWERFVAPTIVKPFFWLSVGIASIWGLLGMAYAIQLITVSPALSVLLLLASVLGVLAAVVLTRIVTEFVLILFRVNEQLGEIRRQNEF